MTVNLGLTLVSAWPGTSLMQSRDRIESNILKSSARHFWTTGSCLAVAFGTAPAVLVVSS